MGSKQHNQSQFYGEQYERNLRVTSQYTRTIFKEIEDIRNNMNFKHHRFMTRSKRNNSTGSAQAFLVEICLTDEIIRKRLQEVLPYYMEDGGANWKPTVSYQDRY